MLGHPRGLFPLFFTEMWERHSFYLLSFTLLLYLTGVDKGALGKSDGLGNEVVGTYLAFVYFTPFLGGLLADRYLGFRRAVLLGGVLMASGFFLMAAGGYQALLGGLLLVCVGNGFFKPNISVMVGNIYEKGDPKRDAGFNIFYMGINIGAFIGPLTASSLRTRYDWSAAFIAGGVGLLIGCAILLLTWRSLDHADRKQGVKEGDMSLGAICLKILVPAFLVGALGYVLRDRVFTSLPVSATMCAFLAGVVPILVFFVRLARNAAPEERPGLLTLLPVYVAGGTFFMILHLNSTALLKWANADTDRHSPNAWSFVPGSSQDAALAYFHNAAPDTARPDERTLHSVGDREARLFESQTMDETMVQAVVAMPGSELQLKVLTLRGDDAVLADGPGAPEQVLAGRGTAFRNRSVNVFPAGAVTLDEKTDSHGSKVMEVQVAQDRKAERVVVFTRTLEQKVVPVALVTPKLRTQIYERAGSARLPVDATLPVTNPEMFSQANAFFVVALTPVVVAFFQWLVKRGRGVTTARKIFYGLLLTAGSMGLMVAAGAASGGGTVKVSWLWLVGAYAIVTLGELCLSPMGLSLVTKLSPPRFVGLMMGGWFVATAFGNKLSGFLGGIQGAMDPMWFFLLLAGAVLLVALFIRALLPQMERALAKYGA